MPRLRDILQRSAAALAILAVLAWTFRVHLHATPDGHVEHGAETCQVLDLVEGGEPEPHGDAEHCDCPASPGAPAAGIETEVADAASTGLPVPETMVMPDGVQHQPDPPPVRA